MRKDWLKCLALLVPVMTGCLSHTRKLQQPKLVGPVMNADAVQLVEAVNQRYAQVTSLSATVDFAASVGGARKGKQTDYTSIHGYIRLRKPEMLRVLGYLPVVRLRAFDLVSDGKTFTLLIPPKDRAIEDLRPEVFFNSILIRSISPDSIVSLTNSSQTRLDPKSKQLIEQPQYDLTVLQPGAPSSNAALARVAKPLRVIHFSRSNLKPTGQDIYDADGDLETQVTYGPYQDFNGSQFPSTITIDQLLAEYKITLTVEKLVLNQPLADDQFELTVPEGYKVQKLP
jgi:outer membrane lipoprotein-sorting protein